MIDEAEFLYWEALAVGGIQQQQLYDLTSFLVDFVQRPIHEPYTAFPKTGTGAPSMPKRDFKVQHVIPNEERPDDRSE